MLMVGGISDPCKNKNKNGALADFENRVTACTAIRVSSAANTDTAKHGG